MIGWQVTSPSVRGNCTIRISDTQLDSSFKTLIPLDNSADENGYFPCGRAETQFEAKEVRLPREWACQSCIIELLWKTEKGK